MNPLTPMVWETLYPDRRKWSELSEDTQNEWSRFVDIVEAIQSISVLNPAMPVTYWKNPKQESPREGEWVLHTYAGVRPPEYGMYARGRFWRNEGPESFPTTHWLRVPDLPDSSE